MLNEEREEKENDSYNGDALLDSLQELLDNTENFNTREKKEIREIINQLSSDDEKRAQEIVGKHFEQIDSPSRYGLPRPLV